MKYTTLNYILKEKEHLSPTRLEGLIGNLKHIETFDEPISLKEILRVSGLNDAVWALRTLSYRETCLFQADVAESVLHIFESAFPEDDGPRKAIEAIRKWHAGEISREELNEARSAVDAYVAVCNAAAYATDAAYDATAAAAGAAGAAKWKEIEVLFIKHFCGE